MEENPINQNAESIQSIPPSPNTIHEEKVSFLKSKWLKIGIVVVVLVLLMGGIYTLGRNSVFKELNPTTPAIPSPDETSYKGPTSTPNPTADWKTYTNTKVGFQIKYPDRYPQPELPSGPGPTLNTTGTEDNIRIIFGNTTEDSIALQVFPFTGSVENLTTYKDTPSSDSNSKLTLVKTLKLTNGNALWYTALPPTVLPEDKGKIGATKIYFTGSNHGFILDSNINHSSSEIEQMLNSFKFTDSSSSTDTSTWKTYTNTSFSFKYPEGVILEDKSVPGIIQVILAAQGFRETKVSASKNDLSDYYLDTAPSGKANIGEVSGNKYFLPQGYCDGPSCSSPILATSIIKNGTKYVFSVYVDKEHNNFTDLENQILSTFKFTQ